MSTSVPVISVSRPRRCQDRGGGAVLLSLGRHGYHWSTLLTSTLIPPHTDTTQHFPTAPLKHTHTCQLNLVLNQKTFRTTHNTGRCTRPAGPNPPPPCSCISRPRRPTCQSRSSNTITPGHHSPSRKKSDTRSEVFVSLSLCNPDVESNSD